jgi:hypothetical protein
VNSAIENEKPIPLVFYIIFLCSEVILGEIGKKKI